ncbi:MAG TPA: hypothetical protein VFT69_00940 [Pseudolabrys sp.]|jgi:hypothetical protein|nr:hypothetical protein [Pseudolabrys sp.]
MQSGYGTFAALLGGIVALGALLFIASGGGLGGKTTINSDRDLPPIADTAN